MHWRFGGGGGMGRDGRERTSGKERRCSEGRAAARPAAAIHRYFPDCLWYRIQIRMAAFLLCPNFVLHMTLTRSSGVCEELQRGPRGSGRNRNLLCLCRSGEVGMTLLWKANPQPYNPRIKPHLNTYSLAHGL